MTRYYNQEEKLRIAAEKMKLKREKEAREEKEFYERITSGKPWLFFKFIVVFCGLMFVLSLIEHFVDGPTKKISEKAWKINRDWEYTWHKVLDVEGYMFTPNIADWSDRVENSLELTYSPIFKTGKKLSYLRKIDENTFEKALEYRQQSVFNWFPFFQLFLLIPIFTFLFKRQSAWFNFARIASMVLVFPGTLLVLYFPFLS